MDFPFQGERFKNYPLAKKIVSFVTNLAEFDGELFTLVFLKNPRKQRSLAALKPLKTHRNHMKCMPRLCEPTESINVLLFLSFLSLSGVFEIFHEISLGLWYGVWSGEG